MGARVMQMYRFSGFEATSGPRPAGAGRAGRPGPGGTGRWSGRTVRIEPKSAEIALPGEKIPLASLPNFPYLATAKQQYTVFAPIGEGRNS